jgi:hypothetical protein
MTDVPVERPPDAPRFWTLRTVCKDCGATSEWRAEPYGKIREHKWISCIYRQLARWLLNKADTYDRVKEES